VPRADLMETLLLRQAEEKRLTANVGELAELVELSTVPLEGKVPQLPLRTGPHRRRHETELFNGHIMSGVGTKQTYCHAVVT
jgi:hypothetical protein